jgi:hypothetical protein
MAKLFLNVRNNEFLIVGAESVEAIVRNLRAVADELEVTNSVGKGANAGEGDGCGRLISVDSPTASVFELSERAERDFEDERE